MVYGEITVIKDSHLKTITSCENLKIAQKNNGLFAVFNLVVNELTTSSSIISKIIFKVKG